MGAPSTLYFLPGALGRTEFWRPASSLLTHPARQVHVSWPGFGGAPTDPGIRGLDDLASRLLDRIDGPSALVAQSMGGVVALLASLRKPELITHLVLTATSGGLPMDSLGAQDWRPAIRAAHPGLPDWFASYRQDLSASLPELRIPTLLLWGDADPISPLRAGERLASLLPQAELQVFPHGEHDVGCAFAAQVAPLIDRHLALRC
ncbi:alpha/beta fold hydrolase [Massilia sp. AB1]|uniref:alpha/beta fold hydrolase n=1 Tax=Massilia sp. AB1 TaxID=2823371 RepID=UPI001B82D1B5|nr:alpha/beta fold hydrolase [Massilia sp. AB1]